MAKLINQKEYERMKHAFLHWESWYNKDKCRTGVIIDAFWLRSRVREIPEFSHVSDSDFAGAFNAYLNERDSSKLAGFGIDVIETVSKPAKSHEITVIDKDRINKATTIDERIQQRAKVFILNTLIDLGEIANECYYRELGYNSLNEYIMDRLNLSPGHASKMVAVVTKILPRLLVSLRNFSDNSLLDNKLENGAIVVTTDIKTDIPFDMEKLYALSKLKSEWIQQLFENGKVRLRGKWITLDDLSSMSRQQVFDIVDAAMNSRRTPEEIKAEEIPWKRYKIIVYRKLKKFQGDLQDIHESPSLPDDVRADLDEAIKGLDQFWDKYFPEVPEEED